MNQEQEIEVNISIRKIKVLSLQQFNVPDIQKIPNPNHFIVDLKLGFLPVVDKDYFIITVYVDIRYKDEVNPVMELMNTAIEISYSIQDMHVISKLLPDGNFEMSNAVMGPLVLESLATVRGILFVKNLGTLASRTTIPMVDPYDLLEKYKIAALEQQKSDPLPVRIARKKRKK